LIPNVIEGSTGPNILSGMDGNDRLTGDADDDQLRGGTGDDTLAGSEVTPGLRTLFGRNEIDTLTGAAGSDLFVLGVPASILYDDGSSSNPGRSDYALVTDFTTAQGDQLQLKGAAADYLLGNSPLTGITGKALYHDTNGNGIINPASDELIAILQSSTTLNRTNTIDTARFV
jgi:Ca2+-binding RTX toxin-like protein